MPFCSYCGNQNQGNARFCQSCGQPIFPAVQPFSNAAPQAVTFPAPSQPFQLMSEPVRIIVPDLQQNNALGTRDSYYLVVTQQRSLFIKINQSIAQKAQQQRQVKNQDKGFLGRWKEQIAGPDMYLEYLQTRSPAEMFGESPESYSIDNMQIQQVSVKYYFREDSPSEWYLGFQMAGGFMKYVTTSDPEKLLASAYPGLIVKQK